MAPGPSAVTRVLTAMSGGVDSSVAALLLRDAGHEVIGVFMRNGVTGNDADARSCCSASDSRDAALVAHSLGIPFYSLDYADEFAGLMDHFAAEYRQGRTPNPCVLCNQHLKFGHLFSMAEDLGAEAVATGHYARQVDGLLYRSVDRAKDQTYYLFGVDRQAVGRAMFPLGELTKKQVRQRARDAGLVTAEKPESMEICFVTSGDYRDVVRARGGRGRPGRFLDRWGQVVGTHDGLDGFTVGQRRRLPALGVPHYVREIRPDSGDVVLAVADDLYGGEAVARGVNWLVEPPGSEGLQAQVKVRARSDPAPARVVPLEGETEAVRLEFEAPVFAISPGQAAVFYRDDLVLGGGWID